VNIQCVSYEFSYDVANHALQSSKFEDASNSTRGLKGLMYKNIDTLHRIRHTHSQLTVLTNPPDRAEGVPAPPLTPLSAPKRRATRRRARRKRIPLEGGGPIADTTMRTCVQDVLEHAGFEGEFDS
jgi:hypothetical protein